MGGQDVVAAALAGYVEGAGYGVDVGAADAGDLVDSEACVCAEENLGACGWAQWEGEDGVELCVGDGSGAACGYAGTWDAHGGVVVSGAGEDEPVAPGAGD